MTEKCIILGRPRLERSASGVRLCSDVELLGQKHTAWIEVADEYAKYLTDDRLDAFVAAFLPAAMREGADLVCEGPVSRRLLYQVKMYLIPVLSAHMAVYREIAVEAAPTDSPLTSEGAVVTGWTGGVDSMYTLMRSFRQGEPGMQLTHLLIANNGSLESEDNEALLQSMVRRAEDGICQETGLKVIGVNSNLQELLDEPYLAVAGYRLPAVVLALQKLISVFYNSSGYEFSKFTFEAENSAYYEMFLLPHLSTENTVFYSAGGAVRRIDKLRALSDYPLAFRYLHPCVHPGETNCGKCGKCVRTETALFALNTLDRFGEVFDLKAFEDNLDWYVGTVIASRKSQHYGESYVLLREQGRITENQMRYARILEAAKKVAARNKDELLRKMEDAE